MVGLSDFLVYLSVLPLLAAVGDVNFVFNLSTTYTITPIQNKETTC